MATGPNIGYATLSVIPSMRGVQRSLTQQMAGPARSAGQSAGSAAGDGFASRFSALASRAASTAGSAITSTLTAAGRTAMGAIETTATAVGAVVTTSLFKGFGRLTAIDDAEGKLRGLGHTAESIETIMDSALESVRGTAFGLGEAASTAATAVAAGIEPGEELARYLRIVADTATIAGGSLGEIGSIINRTTTAGRVYTLELMQLADRGLPVWTWLQDAYGVTAEELRKMVSDGKIDAERFREIIEENIGGAALASGATFRGGLANVGAAMGRFGETILKPFFEAAKEAFPALIEGFGALSDAVAPSMQRIADSDGFKRVTAWIADAPDHIKGLVGQLRDLGPALAPLGAFVGAMGLGGLASALGPFGAIIPTVNPVVAALGAWVLANDELRESFGNLGSAIWDGLGDIADAAAPLGEAMGSLFTDALRSGVDWLAETAVPAISDFVSSGLESLSAWWAENGDAVIEGFGEIARVWREDIGPVLIVVGGFLWSHMIVPLGELVTMLVNNEGTWTAAAYGLGALAAAMIVAGLAAHPVLLAALAVGALVAATDWLAEKFNDELSTALEWVIRRWVEFSDIVETVAGWLKTAYDWAVKLVEAAGKIPIIGGGRGGIKRPDELLLDILGFDDGGVMPGPRGQHSLAWVAGGETILPTHKMDFDSALAAVGVGGSSPLVGGDLVVQQLPGEDAGTATYRALRRLSALRS